MMIGFAVPVILHIISDMNLNIRISREFYSNHAVAFWTADSDRTDIEYIMGHMEKGDILYRTAEVRFPSYGGGAFRNQIFLPVKRLL